MLRKISLELYKYTIKLLQTSQLFGKHNSHPQQPSTIALRATTGHLPTLSVPGGGAFANFTLLEAIAELSTRTRFPIRI